MKLTKEQIEEILEIINECENTQTGQVSLSMIDILLQDYELNLTKEQVNDINSMKLN